MIINEEKNMNTITFVKFTYPDGDIEYTPFDDLDWLDEYCRLSKLYDEKIKVEFIEVNEEFII